MNVIDVSHWQGTINWAAVKADGTVGVIIKAGGSDDGFYTDSKFEENYQGAKAAGFQVGVYYFVGPDCKSTPDGEADAKRFIEILSGKQFDLPVYIDFEAPDGSNKSGNTDAVIGFCETMEAAGYFVGVYASDISGFKDRLELDRLRDYTLWVARYGSEPVYATSWDIWQYSSEGYINGISGRVDLNNCRTAFHDTIVNGGFNGYTKAKSEAPKAEPEKTVCIGAAIKIKEGAKNWNDGATFASWVYDTVYVIQGISENGARIAFGNENGTTGATHISNIILV